MKKCNLKKLSKKDTATLERMGFNVDERGVMIAHSATLTREQLIQNGFLKQDSAQYIAAQLIGMLKGGIRCLETWVDEYSRPDWKKRQRERSKRTLFPIDF